MNDANGAQYKRYDRSGKSPSYQIVTLDGARRDLATTEVPAYVIGHADSYAGFREHVQEVLDKALSNPEVGDRESLMVEVLAGLDRECGDHLRKAAAYFLPTGDPSAAVAAA
ncbi:hypothetical protein [Streptomyces sp. NPDC059278]|uniref:hypothetical protein n=1 Tax=Streptomyces sp. NPDC059278 TaxID=3346801 RepID=UPI0036A31F47